MDAHAPVQAVGEVAPVSRPVCCVVNEGCMVPANLEASSRPERLPECFQCGQDVCRVCSSVRRVRGRWRRLCDDCQEENGDVLLVEARMYARAGYPEVARVKRRAHRRAKRKLSRKS